MESANINKLRAICSHLVFRGFSVSKTLLRWPSVTQTWVILYVLRPSVLWCWWLSSHLWGHSRPRSKSVNPSSAHFNGCTRCTCRLWQKHMSSYLVIMSLAFSIQSCGEQSAPAQPSVSVFKKATVSDLSAVISIMSENRGCFPPLTLSSAAWGISFTLIKAMTCPPGWVRGPGCLTLADTSWGASCHQLWQPQSLRAFRQLLLLSCVCLLRCRRPVTQPCPSTTGWTGFRGHRRLIESWIRYGDAWPARDFTVHCFLPSCLCTLLPHRFNSCGVFLLQHCINPLFGQLASVFIFASSKHQKILCVLEAFTTSVNTKGLWNKL